MNNVTQLPGREDPDARRVYQVILTRVQEQTITVAAESAAEAKAVAWGASDGDWEIVHTDAATEMLSYEDAIAEMSAGMVVE